MDFRGREVSFYGSGGRREKYGLHFDSQGRQWSYTETLPGDTYDTQDIQVVDMRGSGYPGPYRFWAGLEYMYKGIYPAPENHLLRMQRSLIWESNWEIGIPGLG